MVTELDNGFAIAILNYDGKVLNYTVPLNISYQVLREGVKIGYDAYRTMMFIAKELGYSMPKRIVIEFNEFEEIIMPQAGKIVIVITEKGNVPTGLHASSVGIET